MLILSLQLLRFFYKISTLPGYYDFSHLGF